MDPDYRRFNLLCIILGCVLSLMPPLGTANEVMPPTKDSLRNAYATMMYMGTPRDYEFYIAIRVMLRTLRRLKAEADLVVIASKDVPNSWTDTMRGDGAKVVTVDNIENPYRNQPDFNERFTLTLNKLYAWRLVEYERIVMLDADNVFLHNTDELFQCGQFCAVFINPCIFHTGLFVLQPSMDIFNDMLNQLAKGQENKDGADQGFLVGYFNDLLDRPTFHPRANGSRQNGFYRLPLGYQMDASFYYLKLRWNVPCGPNSVITFPSAPWVKPWYWWSWPVLPLGLLWHEHRHHTIGYGAQIPLIMVQMLVYIIIMVVTIIGGPYFSKLCYKQPEKECSWYPIFLKILVLSYIVGSYLLPALLIPKTIHPIIGWGIYLLGSISLINVIINAFQLPILATLTPWIGIFGVLIIMAFPLYNDGISRALSVFAYAFLAAPFLWWAIIRVMTCLDSYIKRELLSSRSESPHSELMKLY